MITPAEWLQAVSIGLGIGVTFSAVVILRVHHYARMNYSRNRLTYRRR